MSSICDNCERLKALVDELIEAIKNLLEANGDAGKPFLPELYRLGLEVTVREIQGTREADEKGI